MKRGKRFLENDKTLIYVGTAIFFGLAIALGIIMYMTNRTATKIENDSGQFVEEARENSEASEAASTEIGKTVEEQENSMKDKNTNNEILQNSDSTNGVDAADNNKTANSEKSNITGNTVKKVEDSSKNEKETNNDTNKNIKNEINGQDTNTDKSIDKNQDKKEITFAKPTDGEIICGFAKDNLIYSETLKEWITHTAIDIKADKTSIIKSAADGVIKSIINDPRYGLTVIIEHDDGYETVYSNLLTAEFVVEGEEVTQGQTIGTAGNTSSFESSMDCHLHFELIKDGEYLDPTIYLK